MTIEAPAFTVGVEEEYLLVDPKTRELVAELPDGLLRDCQQAVPADVGAVAPEFLRPQIEVDTSVCADIGEVREKLAALRRIVAETAAGYGYRIIAASTHPTARWHEQVHTDKARYNALAADLQTVAQRLLICGMHVHVGIDDDELRIDLMNQASYFLPHLLVLSTSSPFWQGRDTGLLSYRISVFDELPRTGLPARFDSYGEYCRHLDMLVDAGLIEDATKIWWDVRLSARFPTLEMRITDVCTRIDDSATIAALFVSILSMLVRLRRENQRWRIYSNMLINENRWRAQRYGFTEGLVDFGRGEVVDYADLLEEIIALVRTDAEARGCLAEVEAARDILDRGTSAHRQLAVYREALAQDADEREALHAVVDWLIEETLNGVE